jgi:Icc-related predicted phosphoesterase
MSIHQSKVLSLSDMLVSFVYSPQVRCRFGDIDLLIGCGDLAYYYLEYVLDALDVPCFFVRGNHDKVVEYSLEGQRTAPAGAVDLHGKVIYHRGLLLAGVEGSLRYRPGPFQYAHSEMWGHVFRLVPGLIGNKLRYGRYLDVFVSHSPPQGIHDMPDLPHQGIKAFRWLLKVFIPAYHFHGHVHIYRPDTVSRSYYGDTVVINSYGYRETVLEINHHKA